MVLWDNNNNKHNLFQGPIIYFFDGRFQSRDLKSFYLAGASSLNEVNYWSLRYEKYKYRIAILAI